MSCSDLKLSCAMGAYDRTAPLRDGRVKPAGIALNIIGLRPAETFWRQLKFKEFEIAEMSLSAYIMQVARGDRQMVALPVFLSRVFRRSAIYVRSDSTLESAADLRGKRVGVTEYHQTAGLFIRGFLQDDYDLAPQDVTWVQAGMVEAGRKERVEFELPADIRLERVTDRSLDDLLAAGEIDAIAGARTPTSFVDGSGRTRRLFPNAMELDVEAYHRTKIFPIMHVVTVRADVYDAHPWIGRSLWTAFEEAKAMAREDIADHGAEYSMIPFFNLFSQQVAKDLPADLWSYGIEQNVPTLDAATRYSVRQGLSPRKVDVAELFPENLRESYRS